MLRQLSLLLLAVLFLASSCSSDEVAAPERPPEEPPEPRGGIALSFDDDFVDQWFAQRELFARYDARVTFFVTRFAQLEEGELERLRTLEADGHEIGCHGVSHLDAREAESAERYVREEVEPALAAMAAQGFTPASFAYPWGGRSAELDWLLARRFPVVRGSGRLEKLERSLVEPGNRGLVIGASIDSSKADAAAIVAALREAKAQKKVVVLYAHRITADDIPQSHITPETLEAVLAEAKALDLPFLTMSELAGAPAYGAEVIYPFLDTGDRAVADEILQDRWPIPRFDTVDLGWPLTWAEDPYGENYWRFLFYSLRETRNLLWAYRTTLDSRYLEKLRALLIDFDAHADDSPFIREKHGAAFRAMVIANTYWKLWRMNALDPEFEAALRSQVRKSAAFLATPKNFEDHDNHGITQAAALLLLGIAFPDEADAADWRELGLQRVDRMLAGMVDADGVQIEQSPYYHFYVFEFFQQIHTWAARHGIDVGASALGETVDRMLRFASYVTQPDGTIPLLGASIRFDVRVENDASLDPAADQDEHFAWVRSGGERGVPPSPDSVLFPTAGFSILRSGFAAHEAETQVIFDVGPYRTAHSHLDALHVQLYAAGRPLLVDSGLFTYEAGPAFDYFHGTRAHNTVQVDGADQDEGSAQAGQFKAGDGWAWQSAAHRLYEGVVHRRGVLLLARDLVLVLDELESDATHDYAQHWHLFPGAEIAAHGLLVAARDEVGADVLQIRPLLTDGLGLATVRGAASPKQGWYSELYEQETPAWVATYSRRAKTAAFATLFVAGERVASEVNASAAHVDGRWAVDVVVDGKRARVAVDGLAGPGEVFDYQRAGE